MANFVVCVDPDSDRRRKFMHAAKARLAPFPGLARGSAAGRDCEVAWAISPRAPFSHVADTGGTGILFGEMIGADGKRLSATEVRERWSEPSLTRDAAASDGYYAACVQTVDGRLLVGGDLIGMFPIYYYQSSNVLLVGASPETFALHPSFRAAFNPVGLTGILLTNGLFEGASLWSGVKRLDPGHLLVHEVDAQAKELRYFDIPITDRYLDLSFSNHLDLLDKAMADAVNRHAAAETQGILLSGGLDSRTIAGYLNRTGGARKTVALTLGTPTDLEVRCASTVARSLGMRQQVKELDSARYVEYASLHTTWEHCAAGSSLLMQWGLREMALDLPPTIISGLGLDWVLGGHAPTVPNLSFESFFEYSNAWGLAPSRLAALLRPDVFSDASAATLDRMRKEYAGYSDVESRRAWCFALYHRQRFHIGSEAWRLTFAGWPAVPATAGALIQLGAGLPPATAADRRAQYELLRTRFPDLASLPLDHNSNDTTPLQPRLRWLLRDALATRVQRLRRKRTGNGKPAPERRRYYRVFDINGAGWRAVRREAETCRTLAYDFFDKKAFDELLPPPDADIRSRDGIADVGGVKSVIGFLLWARDHL
jgi:asparagine synthase (glutamine-hydrolysing)